MKLKKTLAALATAGTGLSLATVGSVAPASAASAAPPYGYGFNAQIITGGGSDTTYKAMIAISDLYNTASVAGCVAQTDAVTPPPAINQCRSTVAPTEVNANFERDTVAQASPAGSSSGIASLNADAVIGGVNVAQNYPYAGASSPGQALDFARSSRAPKITGGNCAGGNELTCDTFWGFAEDGVEVFGFGSHGGINLNRDQLIGIYMCQFRTWGDVLGNGDTQPIVPWGMNPASGTFATFNAFLGFNVNTKLSASPYPTVPPAPNSNCVRQLSTNVPPFENDVKPLFADVEKTSGFTAGGVNDPNNWLWFGSFGLLSAFPYDNNFTTTAPSPPAPFPPGTVFSGSPDSVNSVFPSTSSIFGLTYPIARTLYHVTAKSAADCAPTGPCDLTGGPTVNGAAGPVDDVNVIGATGGTGGAVREFTRFLCRKSGAQDPVDPFSGTNLFSEENAAKSGSGFTAVPISLRATGSSCQVMH